MFEEISVFDEGTESEPAVSEAATETQETAEVAASSGEDSAAETAETTAAESEKTDDSEGDKVSETDEKDEESSETLLDSVDKEIANDKHPKWFRDKLTKIKTAFLSETETVKSTYEPLKDYGEVDKIAENLEILKGLETFENDPATNLPTATVKPFVDKLVEKKGMDTVVQVMQEFGKLESPLNKGWTLMHEVFASSGLDPDRLEDFKKFQANGYQLANDGFIPPDPEELALIPENLREAFTSLNPEEREEILLLNESVRDKALTGIQRDLDADRKAKEDEQTRAQQEAAEKQEAEQKFYQAVAEKEFEHIDSSGSKLFDSFAESLVNTGLDEIETLGITNLMSMTLNSQGVEAKRNVAALEKIGVKIDESLISTFNEWQQAARTVAVFEVQGNEQQTRQARAQFEALEEKLIRKSNPIVAAIAKYRAEAQRSQSQSKSDLLTELTETKGITNSGNASAIGNGAGSTAHYSELPTFAS